MPALLTTHLPPVPTSNAPSAPRNFTEILPWAAQMIKFVQNFREWAHHLTDELSRKFYTLSSSYNLLIQTVIPDTANGLSMSNRDITAVESLTTKFLTVSQAARSGTVAIDAAVTITLAITFPNAFAAGVTPIILIALNEPSDAAARFDSVRAEAITNTGFNARATIAVAGAPGATARFHWVALKP